MSSTTVRFTVTSLLCASIALAAASATEPALAQDKVTVAEGLFREGKKLMDAGDYAAACEKLAESQRLDPSSGTLLNLAACHEKQGKIATAWAEYLAAARLAQAQNRPKRVEEAKQRAAELEPKVSYLKIVLAEKLPGTTVKIDEVTLESSALGSQIPVDPGERAVQISAPGYKALTMKIAIGAEHDVQTVTVPKLEKEEGAAAAPTEPGKGPTPVEPAGTPTTPGDTGPTPAKSTPILPYVIGGAGVVALGVGTAFALMARSAYSDAEDACPSAKGCSADAMDKRDTAETRANIANVGFGLGVVGVGVAAVLLLTAPKESASRAPTTTGFKSLRVSPFVGETNAGLAVSGVTF